MLAMVTRIKLVAFGSWLLRCPRWQRWSWIILAVASTTFLGCATTRPLLQSNLPEIPGRVQVLLLPPDIELFELTAGGVLEPKAEWTKLAREHVAKALREELKARDDNLITYEPPGENPTAEHMHQQLIKLHTAVGQTIVLHKILGPQLALELPTKKDKFDWSLGQNAQTLREGTDADYGLFMHVRDSYASAGRVAVIVVAALLRVGVSGGQQVMFASLVDLKTGNLVWFNLLARAAGDLRTAENARDAVKELLEDLPL